MTADHLFQYIFRDVFLGKLTFHIRCLGVDFVYYDLILSAGNPLSQDILNIYQEPDGTRKLLNYMLDNLAGKGLGCAASQSSFTFKTCFIECIMTSLCLTRINEH